MTPTIIAILGVTIALWLIYQKLDDLNDTLKRIADSLDFICDEVESDEHD